MAENEMNELNGMLRKLLLMAIIEKMESDIKRAETESKAFATMESENARIVICLN